MIFFLGCFFWIGAAPTDCRVVSTPFCRIGKTTLYQYPSRRHYCIDGAYSLERNVGAQP